MNVANKQRIQKLGANKHEIYHFFLDLILKDQLAPQLLKHDTFYVNNIYSILERFLYTMYKLTVNLRYMKVFRYVAFGFSNNANNKQI